MNTLKKAILISILVLFGICTLPKIYADDTYDEDLSGTYTFYDLRKKEEVTFTLNDGKPSVVLFGNISKCTYTSSMLYDLCGGNYDLSQFNLYCFDLKNNPEDEVLRQIEGYGPSVYIGRTESTSINNLLFKIKEYATQNVTPYVAFVDGNGHMKQFLECYFNMFTVEQAMEAINISPYTYSGIMKLPLEVTFHQTEARKQLDLINEFRTGPDAWYWSEDDETKTVVSNLKELYYDEKLEKVAMQRAVEIALYYSHYRTDGNGYTAAFSENNCSYRISASENIAAGFTSSESAFKGWCEDDEPYYGQGHRRNMLSNKWYAVGCACVYYDGYYYWTQAFSDFSNNDPIGEPDDSTCIRNVVFDYSLAREWSLTRDEIIISDDTDILDCTRVLLDIDNPSYGPQMYPRETCLLLDWKPDDQSVAIYEDGFIKPIKPGRTVFSAMTPDGRTELFFTVIVDSPEHEYDDPVYSWSDDNGTVTASAKCTKCGKTVTEKVQSTCNYIKESSCTEEGIKEYTANFTISPFTTQIKRVTVKAFGHDYEFTEWQWKSLKNVYAVFTCQNDPSHVEKISAAVRFYENDWNYYYTASVIFEGQEYTDDKKFDKDSLSYTVRVSGDNRYETSLKTAEELRRVLGVNKFYSVVLTTGNDFADALSGSYLANKTKSPVIMVRDNTKNTPYLDNVINYIKEHIMPNGVICVLGGEAAIPDDWLTGLSDYYMIYRIEGNNRYSTNIEVLNEVGYTDGDILVCTGNDFADSLSASAVDFPIFLVNGTGKLSKTQKTYLSGLSNVKFHIIGGEAAVSKEIENALAEYGTVVERIAGGTRYETSKLIAERFFSEPDKAVLAYGHNFPDGLGGGALAHALKSPLILAGSSRPRSRFAIDYCTGKGITSGYVLGGKGLISDDYLRQIFSLEDDVFIIEK